MGKMKWLWTRTRMDEASHDILTTILAHIDASQNVKFMTSYITFPAKYGQTE